MVNWWKVFGIIPILSALSHTRFLLTPAVNEGQMIGRIIDILIPLTIGIFLIWKGNPFNMFKKPSGKSKTKNKNK